MKKKEPTKPKRSAEKEFAKLTKIQKIETLWSALDYMSQYNGRSRWECISLAMGIDINEP